jgi:hypothetical protein
MVLISRSPGDAMRELLKQPASPLQMCIIGIGAFTIGSSRFSIQDRGTGVTRAVEEVSTYFGKNAEALRPDRKVATMVRLRSACHVLISTAWKQTHNLAFSVNEHFSAKRNLSEVALHLAK